MEFHSVNKLFQENFVRNWFRPAVSDFHGETFTFEDVCNRIARYHLFYEQAGIAKGDKVAVCGQNTSGWAMAFLATMTWGAVPVPILNDFTPDNIRHLLEHSDARLLLTDAGICISAGEAIMHDERHITKALHCIPADRLFLETDTWDGSIRTIYKRAAELLKTDDEALREIIFANFARITNNRYTR